MYPTCVSSKLCEFIKQWLLLPWLAVTWLKWMSLLLLRGTSPCTETEIYVLRMACIKTSYLLYNALDFLHVFSTSLTFTNKRFTQEQTWAKAGMQRPESKKISLGGGKRKGGREVKSKILENKSGLFRFCLSPESGPNGYPIPDPNPKFFSIPYPYPICFQNHRVFRVSGISENYVWSGKLH